VSTTASRRLSIERHAPPPPLPMTVQRNPLLLAPRCGRTRALFGETWPRGDAGRQVVRPASGCALGATRLADVIGVKQMARDGRSGGSPSRVSPPRCSSTTSHDHGVAWRKTYFHVWLNCASVFYKIFINVPQSLKDPKAIII